MSSEDLKKGGRWQTDLSSELEKDSFGILCLTPSNLTAPWVLFEAGALSKSVGDAQVAPLLLGVKPSELPAPLTQFNAVNLDLSDFKKLLRDINARVPEETVPVERVERSIEGLWDKIESELKEAVESPKTARTPAAGAERDLEFVERFDAILQELLVLNRNQSKLLASPEQLLPREYLEEGLRRERLPSPVHAVWEDLFGGVYEVAQIAETTGDVALLKVANKLQRVTDYLGHRLGPRFGRPRPRPSSFATSDIAAGVDAPAGLTSSEGKERGEAESE